jgi:hypothetical protein
MNSNWQSKIGNAENGLSHHAFLLEGEISSTRVLGRHHCFVKCVL